MIRIRLHKSDSYLKSLSFSWFSALVLFGSDPPLLLLLGFDRYNKVRKIEIFFHALPYWRGKI